MNWLTIAAYYTLFRDVFTAIIKRLAAIFG